MEGKWTHPQCESCWIKLNSNRRPSVLQNADMETCCFCGYPTIIGIYVRYDGALLPNCRESNGQA